MPDRYDTTGNSEVQFQPDSNDEVLLNKLGITDPGEMEDVELFLLEELQTKLLEEIESDQVIKIVDLCSWHRDWLYSVFDWAGRFRTVNLRKGDFLFAAANFIPKLMNEFEKKFLSIYTPCEGFDEDRLVEALAVCHIELIIIHLFREGNGRLSRVLATIMALQAGMPMLDFTYLAEHPDKYISAIHHGHAGDEEPMKRVFAEVLKASKHEV